MNICLKKWVRRQPKWGHILAQFRQATLAILPKFCQLLQGSIRVAPQRLIRETKVSSLLLVVPMVALAAAAFSVRLGYVSSIVLLLGTARSPPNWNIECFELC